MNQLGNQTSRFIRFSLPEIAVWVLCFVCINSHSFEVRIVLRLFLWIPNSARKVIKNFENCSQSGEPVGKLNQLVH